MDDTNQVIKNLGPIVTEYTVYRLNADHHCHGYVIGDVSCIPLSSYLILAWDALCSTLGVPQRSVSVELTEVVSHDVLPLEGNGAELVIGIHRGSGRFEISADEVTVMSGMIKAVDNVNVSDLREIDGDDVAMNSETAYRILALKGYSYRGKYRSVKSISCDMMRATLKNEDYDLVIESIFQMMLMKKEDFYEIMYIQKLTIDVNNGNNNKSVVFHPDYNMFRCGGVEVKDIVLKKSSINKFKILREKTIVCKQEERLHPKKPQIVKTNNGISIKVVFVATADLCYNDTFDVDDVKEWTGFSGTTVNGGGVMGVLRRNGEDDVTVVDPDLMWPVPPHWTLEEAVTLPLSQVGPLNETTSVLINGVTSLTLALVNVLLRYQRNIFINSENENQRDFIRTLYAEINDVTVCHQREVEEVVGGATGGAGCDLVITLRTHTPHIRVMKCVATDGCYVHVRDDSVDIPLDAATSTFFGKSFKGIHITKIFKEIDKSQKQLFQETILNGIREEWIHPLPHITVNNVLKTTNSVENIIKLPESGTVLSVGRLGEGCYVVVCARRNLGVHVVDKLIAMGAERITINTPEPRSEYLQVQLQKWRQKGVLVKVCSENVISTAACLTLLSRASEVGRVRGVFVTCPPRDVPGNHFGEGQLALTRLDTVTKRICQHLKYFVVFSPMPKRDSPESSFENIFRLRDLEELPILEIKCLDNDTKGVDDESVLIEVLSLSLTTALEDLHTLLPHKLCVVTYSYPETVQDGTNHGIEEGKQNGEHFQSVDDVIADKLIDKEDICVTRNAISRRGLYYTQISIKHASEKQGTTNSKEYFIGNSKVPEPEVLDLKLNENVETVSKLCQKMALRDMRVEDIIHRKTDSEKNLIS